MKDIGTSRKILLSLRGVPRQSELYRELTQDTENFEAIWESLNALVDEGVTSAQDCLQNGVGGCLQQHWGFPSENR